MPKEPDFDKAKHFKSRLDIAVAREKGLIEENRDLRLENQGLRISLESAMRGDSPQIMREKALVLAIRAAGVLTRDGGGLTNATGEDVTLLEIAEAFENYLKLGAMPAEVAKA